MAGMRLPRGLQDWVDARRRHGLSHAHVQMARELGMNPWELGKIDNHRQEPWKDPSPVLLERLYSKRFGRPRPEHVRSIEEAVSCQKAKKAAKRAAKV